MAGLRILVGAVALACLAAPATAMRKLTQGDAGGGCAGLAQALYNGNCKSFTNFFDDNAESAAYMQNDAFQGLVNRAPMPSFPCCNDARAFSANGCGCNQQLINQARPQGVSANAIYVIARATQFSICADGAHGGPVINGCA